MRRVLAAVLAVLTVGAAGCAVTVEDVPMPTPGIGGPGYRLHAVFRDALNLPQNAHVKIGGTDIGTVTAISTTNFLANVEMLIRADIQLPTGTTAELRQATPLGDMFVAMTLPAATADATVLRPGDTIALERTSTGASVEQLMMSVSMLLNGGGLNQAARIATEMNSMFGGRAPQLAHLISELTDVLGDLNARTADLDGVLTGLNTLTGELARRKTELGDAADTFPPLIGLLAENNRNISALIAKVSVTMSALGDFTDTTGPEFRSLFDSIQRLMSGFADMGGNLAGTLDGLHALYPRVMASFDGPVLAVAATVSFLSIGALTDPAGSRPPEIGDLPAFIGSLAQVIEKVIGRLQGGGR